MFKIETKFTKWSTPHYGDLNGEYRSLLRKHGFDGPLDVTREDAEQIARRIYDCLETEVQIRCKNESADWRLGCPDIWELVEVAAPAAVAA